MFSTNEFGFIESGLPRWRHTMAVDGVSKIFQPSILLRRAAGEHFAAKKSPRLWGMTSRNCIQQITMENPAEKVTATMLN